MKITRKKTTPPPASSHLGAIKLLSLTLLILIVIAAIGAYTIFVPTSHNSTALPSTSSSSRASTPDAPVISLHKCALDTHTFSEAGIKNPVHAPTLVSQIFSYDPNVIELCSYHTENHNQLVLASSDAYAHHPLLLIAHDFIGNFTDHDKAHTHIQPVKVHHKKAVLLTYNGHDSAIGTNQHMFTLFTQEGLIISLLNMDLLDDKDKHPTLTDQHARDIILALAEKIRS